MKKIILLLALVVVAVAGCSNLETKISEAKAKEIALSNAGLSESDVKFVRVEKDRDDGRVLYEIEFYSNDKVEYDYEIDANTGDIISFDTDGGMVNTVKKPEESQKPTQNVTIAEENIITAEDAKKIALEKVPGATEENIREFKTDFDDGRKEYEGEIIYNNQKYDFEINAATGEITKWEIESIFD